ncbi:MAG TPA: SPFH domain-containing protein [Rhizomicrobium sp.]|nr:SPFH domain-containing protein [Rhizomicrobium sp.]
MNFLLSNSILLGSIAITVGIFVLMMITVSYRVVVPTNAVHIVQSAKRSTPYGKDMGGNTYYSWPAWLPFIGVKVSVLPLSVFRVELENYAAYDKGRLPFVLDVLAFFRIADPAKAAERLSSIAELDGQLQGIMQGVVRTILANALIEDILGKRAEFSESFTKEVEAQLPQWGIATVKNIELMDIRDAQGSLVIQQIMSKKKSEIEKESRTAVAMNLQAAETAEIGAAQTVATNKAAADEAVGIRNAQKDQMVGIQNQKAQQAIKDEEKNTAEKDMAVRQVQSVRQAEIDRNVQVVNADRDRQVAIVAAERDKQVAVTKAEGQKQQVTTVAEGDLAAAKLAAQGVQAKGEAEGAAETARQMATVNPQITLAKEIGQNEGYQTYLIRTKQVEAARDVGIAQAGALEKADVKVIAQTGAPSDGLNAVGELFSAKGGQAIGSALEGFKNTEAGAAILHAVTGGGGNK